MHRVTRSYSKCLQTSGVSVMNMPIIRPPAVSVEGRAGRHRLVVSSGGPDDVGDQPRVRLGVRHLSEHVPPGRYLGQLTLPQVPQEPPVPFEDARHTGELRFLQE